MIRCGSAVIYSICGTPLRAGAPVLCGKVMTARLPSRDETMKTAHLPSRDEMVSTAAHVPSHDDGFCDCLRVSPDVDGKLGKRQRRQSQKKRRAIFKKHSKWT